MITKGKIGDVVTSITYSVDQYGIITQTITKTLSNSGTTSANAYSDSDYDAIGESSPDNGSLKCVGTNLQDSGAIKTITKTYQGIAETKTFYRISAQASQEPIQTHPAFNDTPNGFATKLAGTGDDAKNGAVFKGNDADSEFDYFPANADLDLGGVTGYLVPTVELEQITVKPNSDASDPDWITDDIYDVADIKVPQTTLNVGTRSWLLMGSTQECFGGAIKSTAIYRLSGAKGWNTAIYTDT
jgi:hypothetical protein